MGGENGDFRGGGGPPNFGFSRISAKNMFKCWIFLAVAIEGNLGEFSSSFFFYFIFISFFFFSFFFLLESRLVKVVIIQSQLTHLAPVG